MIFQKGVCDCIISIIILSFVCKYFNMKRVVIFASGDGSNTENMIHYFRNSKKILIQQVFCNKKGAGVFTRCERYGMRCEWVAPDVFFHSEKLLNALLEQTDFLVLAGFLLKIPRVIVKAFPNKIINLHPSLLPKYGGKGMYGMNVHNAVKKSGDLVTGITIHFVDECYDQGTIIFQASTHVNPQDSPKDIANKVHALEYKYFPRIVENIILQEN